MESALLSCAVMESALLSITAQPLPIKGRR